MIALPTLKFIHVFSGISCFGLLFGMSIYLWRSLKSPSPVWLPLTLKAHFIADGFIGLLLVNQFITGTLMIKAYYFPFNTPWLIAAYVLLSAVTVSWAISCLIRFSWHRHQSTSRTTIIIIHTLAWFNSLAMIAIIHDAITKSTWLPF